MKISALLHIDENVSDTDLTFCDLFLPDYIAQRISESKKKIEVFYSIPKSYSGKLKTEPTCIVRNEEDDVAHLKKVCSKSESAHLIRIFADAPFCDPAIITEMLTLHLGSLAEYTYSENLPPGLSCEIVSRELIDAIPDTEKQKLPLSEVIKANINQFDVELFYQDPDMRNKRLSFRTIDPRDKKIMENIYALHNEIPSYQQIFTSIARNPEILYTGPSYLEIELTGTCELDCIFCYRKFCAAEHASLPVDLYKKILSDTRESGLPYSVCFGGSGEPLEHPAFYEIAGSSLEEDLLQNLVIETNGIHANENFRDFLRTHEERRITVICNINGFDDKTYRALHNADNFGQVSGNIIEIKKSLGASHKLYLQIMKIKETEEFLDLYYDFWEKHDIPIILQKQNTFCGTIEDRRYSDLTPVDRIPCWHLQRDLYILSDGKAGFCKQDIDGSYSRGNLTKETITEIWQRGQEDFVNDYKSQYPEQPDCKSCDEWYTFNL